MAEGAVMEIMVNHVCPVEECVMQIEAGKPCNWCGQLVSLPEKPQESEKPNPLP